MNIKKLILALAVLSFFAGVVMAEINPVFLDPPTDLIVIFTDDDATDPNIIFEFCVPDDHPETTRYSIISDLLVKYTDPNTILGAVDDGFMAGVGDPNIVLIIGEDGSCGEGTKIVTVMIKESMFLKELLVKAPSCVEQCTVTELVIKGNSCGRLSGFKIKPLDPPGGQQDPKTSQNNPKSEPFWLEEDLEYTDLEAARKDIDCDPLIQATTGGGNNGKGKGKGKPDK